MRPQPDRFDLVQRLQQHEAQFDCPQSMALRNLEEVGGIDRIERLFKHPSPMVYQLALALTQNCIGFQA